MIDILLAAYNGSRFLPELLQSLQNQTEQDYRVLWHDDGSTDNTSSLLETYSFTDGRYSCPSKKVFHSSSGSFFELLSYSSAAYTMFCDQDDVWHRDKVEKTLHAMQMAEDRFGAGTPLLVHTDLRVTDENGLEIAPSLMQMQQLYPERDSLSRLLCQSLVTGCTIMINEPLRKLILEHLPEKCLMHDWWLSLAAAAMGQIIYFPEQTIDYRQHSGNVVGAKKVSSFAYIFSKLKNTQKLRSSMSETYQQAAEFYRCFSSRLTPERKELIMQYASLQEKPFLQRRSTVRRLGTVKCGAVRRIAQWIFL